MPGYILIISCYIWAKPSSRHNIEMRFIHSTLLLLLALSQQVLCQTSQGLEHFNNKKYKKAWNAFVKDTGDVKESAAAFYGLAKVCAQLRNKGLDTAVLGRYYLDRSETVFKNNRKAITKNGKALGMSASSFQVLRKTLAQNGWKEVETRQKLADFEFFCQHFPEYTNNKQIRSYKKISEEIVNKTFYQSNDYDNVMYLLKTYGKSMGLENSATGPHWEDRIWQLFLDGPGIGKFNQFIRDYPGHPILKECNAAEYAALSGEQSLRLTIQFIIAHPLGFFAKTVEEERLLEQLSAIPGQKDSLNMEEKTILEGIIAARQIISSLDTRSAESPDTSVVINLMKATFPAYQSFTLFDGAFKWYKRKNKYDEAWSLVRAAGNLYRNTDTTCAKQIYPDSAWFINMTRLLAPAPEKLVAKPVTQINTVTGSEYLPVLSPDKGTLYFIGTGRSDGIGSEDPYEVPLNGVEPGTPRLVEGLASPGHEALLSITADGKEAFIFSEGKLHSSEKKDGKWQTPKRISEISDRFGWVGTAQVTNDGSVMLFEAKKGISVDLYVSFRQNDGKWGEPVRLPDNINTSYDDRSPSILLDGKIMYYSTAGHLGLGGMDVFKTTRLDDSWMKWSDPVNLGRAINTDGDEWGFNFAVASDGKTAFFAKRTGNLQDLMMTELPVSMRVAPVKMINLPVKSVDVTFLEVRNSAGDLIQSIRVKPGSEEVLVSVPEENWNEKITITPKTGDDVITTPVTVDMKKPPAVLDTVMAVPVRSYIENRENFKIGAVQFDLAESELKAEAKVALDKFCTALATQKVSIFITGHTDDNGSESDNQKLSEKRVAAVKSYMVSRGIPEKSITATGKGETEPKVPNTSDRNRAINRRVEFRLE